MDSSGAELELRSVLVTGADGFLGANLCRRLAAAEVQVHAVDLNRPSRHVRWYLREHAARVDFIQADLASARLDQLPPVDTVVHAAAVTVIGPGCERDQFQEAVAANITATARLLDWALRSGVRRFLHVSSGSVFGGGEGDQPVAESAPHLATDVYGLSKSAAERLADRFAELNGFDLVTARLGTLYGPLERPTGSRYYPSRVQAWCMAAVEGRPILHGDLGLGRDYTHVDDAVEAILRLARHPRPAHRCYNVSIGRQVSHVEVINAIRRRREVSLAADRRPPPHLPRPPLAVERLRAELGWSPEISIEAGIAAHLDWLESLPVEIRFGL